MLFVFKILASCKRKIHHTFKIILFCNPCSYFWWYPDYMQNYEQSTKKLWEKYIQVEKAYSDIYLQTLYHSYSNNRSISLFHFCLQTLFKYSIEVLFISVRFKKQRYSVSVGRFLSFSELIEEPYLASQTCYQTIKNI